MLRWDGFGRSLWFAVLAAAALPVAVVLGGPILGGEASARAFLVGAAGVYAVGLCAERSRRVAALALAVAAGGILLLLPLGLRGTALGAAALVAIGRSAIAWRQRPARALCLETMLGAAGLAVAGFLATGGLAALCLAVWGYFLVQSAYFLVGGRTRRPGEPPRDPFERARVRLERLLDETA